MAMVQAKRCCRRLTPPQTQRIAEALQLQGERAEEMLAEVERARAEYHAAADVESPKSGKQRNLERKEHAQQLRRLEAAAKEFEEALSTLDGEAEDELRKEYPSAALAQTEAEQQLSARRLGATAGTVRVASRRAARQLDPPKEGGRPKAPPELRRLIAQLAGIFEHATGRRPAIARNRDNPHRPGQFERFVGLVLAEAGCDVAEPLPTGLICEVCKLQHDLPERCRPILSRPGMAAAARIECLRRTKAMYHRGRLSQRDKECCDRIDEVLSSHLDDEGKIETIGRFIARTLDVNEAAKRGRELSEILSAEPICVEVIGYVPY
jgi:hypothetical protein